MLPDFPAVKAAMRSRVLRWCQAQIPMIAPVLGQVHRFQQHEGARAVLARGDQSSAEMTYGPAHFEFVLANEEMRAGDLGSLKSKLSGLAEQMAEVQSKLMFARIGEAAESVGNVVDAGGAFQQKHFLEMIEKVQTDFDPETGQPVNQSFVMHPDTAKKVIPQVQAWEKDPEFVAQYERIMDKKREEWRAREACRKLAD